MISDMLLTGNGLYGESCEPGDAAPILFLPGLRGIKGYAKSLRDRWCWRRHRWWSAAKHLFA